MSCWIVLLSEVSFDEDNDDDEDNDGDDDIFVLQMTLMSEMTLMMIKSMQLMVLMMIEDEDDGGDDEDEDGGGDDEEEDDEDEDDEGVLNVCRVDRPALKAGSGSRAPHSPPRLTVTLVRRRISRIISRIIRRIIRRILRVVIILVVGGEQRLWCLEARTSTSAINQFYSAFQKAGPTQPSKHPSCVVMLCFERASPSSATPLSYPNPWWGQPYPSVCYFNHLGTPPLPSILKYKNCQY